MKGTKLAMIGLSIFLIGYGLLTENMWGIGFGVICFAFSAVEMLGN